MAEEERQEITEQENDDMVASSIPLPIPENLDEETEKGDEKKVQQFAVDSEEYLDAVERYLDHEEVMFANDPVAQIHLIFAFS